MAFEAQDEFFIAKILVKNGIEVAVGDPIMITVEDSSYLTSFSNYSSPKNEKNNTKKDMNEKMIISENKSTPSDTISNNTANIIKNDSTINTKEDKVEKPTKQSIDHKVPTVLPNVVTRPKLTIGGPFRNQLSLFQSEYLKKYGHTGHRSVT